MDLIPIDTKTYYKNKIKQRKVFFLSSSRYNTPTFTNQPFPYFGLNPLPYFFHGSYGSRLWFNLRMYTENYTILCLSNDI